MSRRAKSEHVSNAPIGYVPSELFDAREVSIKDGDFSLVNLTDGMLQGAIIALPDRLIEMSEARLKEHCNPDEEICRLRIAFWDEYTAAVDHGRKMRVANILGKVFTVQYFQKAILSDERKVAWMLKPPQDFLLAMRDLLHIGLAQLRVVLTQPIVERVPLLSKAGPVLDHEGKPVFVEKVNVALAKEIRQITESLANRVHGAVVQRLSIDQKTASLNLHAQADPFTAMPTDQLQALDQQLTVLNQKLALAAPTENPELLDVTPISVEDEDILLGTPDRSKIAPGTGLLEKS